MRQPKIFVRLMACAAMVCVFSGCPDDAATGDTIGMGGTDTMGGAQGGGGGEGGSTMPGAPCVRDNLCAEGEYCDRPAEGGVGECREGCRTEPDNCTGNETCDAMTRMCGFTCGSDDDCANPDEYCDADGACVEGCREDGSSCSEPDERGRSQVCDMESRACVSLFPCCTADGCSNLVAEECSAGGGTVLNGANSCSANPCGEACQSDADCGEDLNRYCNIEDGRCADGCRLNTPGSCPENTTCDELKRTCEEVRCFDDPDCPDYQICDPDTNLCRDGCRDDSVCPDMQRCIENQCSDVCDPEDPNACGDGRYCDGESLSCEDSCAEHADCNDAGRFCNSDGECELGCRDDEGEGGEPNNDPENAVEIMLGEANANDVRSGSIDGRVICGNDRDVYAITVGPFERIRVDLHFDRAEGNLDLELIGDCETPDGVQPPEGCVAFEDGAIVADSVNVPERIEFPAADSDIRIQDGMTYYVTVLGSGSDVARRLDYRVEVSTVDARSGCFPDPRDLAEPNDNLPRNATVIPERGGDYLSNICADDVDYFAIEMQPNDGLQVELRPDPGLEIRGYLYAEGQAPGAAALTADNNYRFSSEVGDGDFAPAGIWYLRVEGVDGGIGEYGLTVRRFSSAACGTDGGTEPNGSIDTAVRIDVPLTPADAPMAQLEPQELELAICTEGRPDVDMFCFDVGAGDLLEAAVQTVDVNGQFDVQFVDSEGVFVGQNATSNNEGDPLELATVLQTVAGAYCVRVSGLDGAQGTYILSVARRARPMGMCALDVDEGPRRNDEGETAVQLMSIEEGVMSYRHASYICDPDDERVDEDWFRLNIPEERSNLCVTLDRFDRFANDVDLSVFRDAAVAGGDPCNDTADCEEQNPGSACVRGRCAAPVGEDIGAGADFAMVHINRDRIGSNDGGYLVRVTHRDGNEGPYTVNADIVPESPECMQDIREPNNSDQSATALGSGDIAICNAWICDSPGRNEDEDWYTIEVPANEDRTVMVAFGSSEGRLFMDLTGPDLPGEPQSGNVLGDVPRGGDPKQCINIQGGSMDLTVDIKVHAQSIIGDGGNNRVDYALQVVPTDLVAAGPEGECVRLGAIGEACPPREEWDDLGGNIGRLQPEACWPTLLLP